jgi:hypothetical protein
MIVKRIVGWPYVFGGEEHSGWLPPGAVNPPPTPIRRGLVDLEIDEIKEGNPSAGYLLIQTAQDGSFCWDTWYASIADAEAAAADVYGVRSDAWRIT